MGRLIIERQKAIDLRMPYELKIDGTTVGEIGNGETKAFDVIDGVHTLVITSNSNNMEMVGGATGGLLGSIIGKQIDKAAQKQKKNEAQINIVSTQTTRVICKAGAFDAVIKEIKYE